jgi:hypothetical protein
VGGKGRGRRYRWMGYCGDEGEGFVQVKKENLLRDLLQRRKKKEKILCFVIVK